MKTYRSHKVVRAAKIIGVRSVNVGAGLGWRLQHGRDALAFVDVDDAWVAKHAPAGAFAPTSLVGGYVVSYPDGYLSWSPAKAFEEGYTEAD